MSGRKGKLALWLWLATTVSFCAADRDRPETKLRPKLAAVSHQQLFRNREFVDGPSVTRACLECHPEAAREVMQTSHYQWLGEPELLPGRDQPLRMGKKNLINNYCISIEGNWPKCTICHAGYGWKDASYDFEKEELVDCLVCHDRSGQYAKGDSGLPAPGVDLLAAARSVGRPNRDNCGYCHFNGGGGDAVKHGDLDGSMARPVERIDVHMGRLDFSCTECHRAEKHRIEGKLIGVSASGLTSPDCSDCHSPSPHDNQRLNRHTSALSCQACHIPDVARVLPTKVVWDWSTAGVDVSDADPHQYLKIKGSFIYQTKLIPDYFWFNGRADRYIKGDVIDPEKVVYLNRPLGDIHDPAARIWPFKVHRGKQPYDLVHRYLLVPKTVGEDGFWKTFNWDQALRLGAQAAGLAYSGKFGFVETVMMYNLSHMVAPKKFALQCHDCHSENGRMDWQALGYPGDPARFGGRQLRRLVASREEGE